MCEVCKEVEALRGKRGNYYGYIPVPVWNGKEWEPIAMSLGEKVMCWPEGFDTCTLPRPKYQLGDIVRFRWERPKELQGHILRIRLWGGGYHKYEGEALKVCAFRYRTPFMTYTIYANSHGRWVREDMILEKTGVEQHPIV